MEAKTTVLVVLALILQIAECFSPGWYITETSGGTRTDIGVWYKVECSDLSGCITTSLVDDCKK